VMNYWYSLFPWPENRAYGYRGHVELIDV
jgi:hypothetical protein